VEEDELFFTILFFLPFLMFIFFYYIGYNTRKKEERIEKNKLIKIEKLKVKTIKENNDKKQYIDYLNKSKEGIDMEAMYNLAACYLDGVGVKKNYVEAYYWVTKSEILGDADAPNLKKEIEEVASELQIVSALQRLKEETPK